MSGNSDRRGGSIESRGLGRRMASVLALAGALLVLMPALPAMADEYDPKEAGHPLRILAYVVHPVGVTIDYLVFRPAFWIGSHEPFRTIFGRTD